MTCMALAVPTKSIGFPLPVNLGRNQETGLRNRWNESSPGYRIRLDNPEASPAEPVSTLIHSIPVAVPWEEEAASEERHWGQARVSSANWIFGGGLRRIQRPGRRRPGTAQMFECGAIPNGKG